MPSKKTNETKDSKISIEITEVLPTRKFKDMDIQPFKGEDGKKYEAWAKVLCDYIANNGGKTIIADVDNWDTETDDGTVYHNHKITQIYVDDKPIYEKTPYAGGKGGGYQDSPEKRHSIEAQNAFTGTVLLIIADKCPKDLEKLAYDHAKKSLAPFIKPQEPTQPPQEATRQTTDAVKPPSNTIPQGVTPTTTGLGEKLKRLDKEAPDIWALDKLKKHLGIVGGKGETVSALVKSLKPQPLKEFIESVDLAITNLNKIDPDDVPF